MTNIMINIMINKMINLMIHLMTYIMNIIMNNIMINVMTDIIMNLVTNITKSGLSQPRPLSNFSHRRYGSPGSYHAMVHHGWLHARALPPGH